MRFKVVGVGLCVVALTGCATPFQNSSAPNLDTPSRLARLGVQLDFIRDEMATAELCIADPRTTVVAPTTPGAEPGPMRCAVDKFPISTPAADVTRLTSEVRQWGVPSDGRERGTPVDVSPYDNDSIEAYIRLRKTQIDGLCGLFFDGLSQVKNQTNYGRDLFNIASEFATVAIGVSGGPAEQLAVISGIQLSANDALDASERAMLLSPDPHKVFLLVSQTQDNVARPVGRTFADAENYIRDYARPCTFLGIQAVIDKVLSQEIERNSGGRLEQVNVALDEVLKAVNAVAEPDIATLAGQSLPLYWLFVLAPADGSPEQAHALGLLPTDVKAAVTAALANSPKRAEIQALLQGLDADAPTVRQSAMAARQGFIAEQERAAERQARLDEQRAAAAAERAKEAASLAEQAAADARTREIQAQAQADAEAAQRGREARERTEGQVAESANAQDHATGDVPKP